jgi:hypothetical protein
MVPSESQRGARGTSPRKRGEVEGYADVVARFGEINEQLAAIGEGSMVPRGQRLKIWQNRKALLAQARDAGLLNLEAKCAQLEASDGRPLTFCFGYVRRVSELKPHIDAEIVWGDGCGVVFVDSVTSSRPVFASYCAVCQAKGKARRRADIVARSAAAVWKERLPVAGGWRSTCTGCGERFFATMPQRSRCDRCQH